MLNFMKKERPKRSESTMYLNLAAIDEEIARITIEMNGADPTTEEFLDLVEKLGKLTDTRQKLSNVSGKEKYNHIDVNAALGGIFGLVGIGLIMGYEKTHIITTKAFSFIKGFNKRS